MSARRLYPGEMWACPPEGWDFACHVVGVPQPKGSPRILKRAAKIALTVRSPRCRAWEQDIVIAARRAAPWEPFAEAMRGVIVFEMPKPKRTKRTLPHVKPDLDKLLRAALDPLTEAGVWYDDAQLTAVYAIKTYVGVDEDPGVHIYLARDGGE